MAAANLTSKNNADATDYGRTMLGFLIHLPASRH
jgi:hypothetical protein